MNSLAKIARSAIPDTGILFRKQTYGSKGIDSFLRDVLALANASIDGSRFIVIGAYIDSRGNKRVRPVSEKDFSGKPPYKSLVSEYIEPPLRLRYEAVTVDSKRLGVFEIGDCQDRPYMMRVDYSETLRRGDAYMRLKDTAIKMGRRQLQTLFEKKFQDSVSSNDIEVGFPGDIIHKTLALSSCDISKLPSAIAADKLQQLIDIQLKSRNSGSTSVMARMLHARLFGSDDPYVRRTTDELMQEMDRIRHKYQHEDEHFLFESNRRDIQLVVYNQGQEPIIDASMVLVLPKDDDLFVADRPPKMLRKEAFYSRSRDEIASYPTVRTHNNSTHITSKIGDICVGEPVEVLASPLRVCVGPGLVSRRFGIRYALHGQNLRAPATGTLRLNFTT